MSKLQEFLELGGELHIGMHRGKSVLSVHVEKNGKEYRKGVAFKDHAQLLDYLKIDGDYITCSLRGIKRCLNDC
jgi:hypothetical protein